jgi:hypothetical protein
MLTNFKLYDIINCQMPKMKQVPLSFSKMSNSKFDDMNSYVGYTKSHFFVDCYVSYIILSYRERGMLVLIIA